MWWWKPASVFTVCSSLQQHTNSPPWISKHKPARRLVCFCSRFLPLSPRASWCFSTPWTLLGECTHTSTSWDDALECTHWSFLYFLPFFQDFFSLFCRRFFCLLKVVVCLGSCTHTQSYIQNRLGLPKPIVFIFSRNIYNQVLHAH